MFASLGGLDFIKAATGGAPQRRAPRAFVATLEATGTGAGMVTAAANNSSWCAAVSTHRRRHALPFRLWRRRSIRITIGNDVQGHEWKRAL